MDMVTKTDIQLDFIGYVDRELGNYMVAGGWGVDGVLNRITREHDNVDIMVPESAVKETKKALTDYCNEILTIKEVGEQDDGGVPNMKAVGRDLEANVIVMHPVCYKDNDYTAFETPYHVPFMPIPNEFLHSVNAEVKKVKFLALNPSAQYMSKITGSKRDREDAKRLRPFVDKSFRKSMRVFAPSSRFEPDTEKLLEIIRKR